MEEDWLSEEMYREHIMDHYKNPRNFGELKDSNAMHSESNPLCGDKITMHLKIKMGVVEKIHFSGVGCAISQASASMLTEKVKGMKLTDVKKLKKEDVIGMLNIPISAVRMKCALLALDTVKNTIKIYEEYKE